MKLTQHCKSTILQLKKKRNEGLNYEGESEDSEKGTDTRFVGVALAGPKGTKGKGKDDSRISRSEKMGVRSHSLFVLPLQSLT